MSNKIEINKERIKYLLALYKMPIKELLDNLNENKKKKIAEKDILTDIIDFSLLKRIDKIFEEGYDFYYDFSQLKQSANSSVFFRKTKFGTNLNTESVKVVHQYEKLKYAIDGYNILSDFNAKTDILHCKIQDDAFIIANKIRNSFKLGIIADDKKFLISLIDKCAEHNIYVFEYIEAGNKKHKINIDGFYVKPNMIVIKRQKNYKREIFTLAHELGHCLLNEEEIEYLDDITIKDNYSQNEIEKWCNDFAYFLIMGYDAKELESITVVDDSNDYCMEYVKELSQRTHISKLAIYTRLLLDKKISYYTYNLIRDDMLSTKDSNPHNEQTFWKTPKPIISSLFLRTMQYAYFKGVINEMTFCDRLNVKPNDFEKVLWK